MKEPAIARSAEFMKRPAVPDIARGGRLADPQIRPIGQGEPMAPPVGHREADNLAHHADPRTTMPAACPSARWCNSVSAIMFACGTVISPSGRENPTRVNARF